MVGSMQVAKAAMYEAPQYIELTTGASVIGLTVGTGSGVGATLLVGLSVGCGPLSVGVSVGEELTHLSVLIPKHDSSGLLHPLPEGQGSAVIQLASASW